MRFAGPARGEAWGAGQAGPRAAWDLPPIRKVTVNPAGRRPRAGRRGAGGGSRSCSRAGFAQASAGSPATASPGPCGGPLRGARQAAWSMQAGTERAVRSILKKSRSGKLPLPGVNIYCTVTLINFMCGTGARIDK